MSKKSQKTTGQQANQDVRAHSTIEAHSNKSPVASQDDHEQLSMTSQQLRKRARLGSQAGETTLGQQPDADQKLDRLLERQEVIEFAKSEAVHELRTSMRQRRTQQQAARQETPEQPEKPATQARPRRHQPQPASQLRKPDESVTATGQNETLNSAASQPAAQNICAACSKPIRERYLLMALDKPWHEDCLKCACCDCRLGEVGSSLFTHSDKILCRRDFLRIFGQHGNCAACKRSIPPYEMVMRANELAYHMDCFACQQCQYRFCVGDRFHLTDTHKIICLLCHTDQQQQQQQQAPPIQEPEEESSVDHSQPAVEKAGAPPTPAEPGGPLKQSACEPESGAMTNAADKTGACSLPPASKPKQACAV